MPFEPHLYVLAAMIDGVPCLVEVVVKTGGLTTLPAGHVQVFRDPVHVEPFDAFRRELLAEGEWTGSALTERSGSLTEAGFDEVEVALRKDLEARVRQDLGTPPDETPN